MGTRRSNIKLDYDQRADFETAIGSFNDDLQVEIDVEKGEAVKLDMFASAEFSTFTQTISNVLFFGILSGTDIDASPLAIERLLISDAQVSFFDGTLNISWIVEPPASGPKTYTFTINAIGTGNQINVTSAGLNAIAFRTNQQ
ncbi:hypothetical protein [Alteribacillus bidgolensis]|uniref:Uncharacterized protein n=1 Tax=Alteribacillus bidgolensis TaxID=930129 RepID=A0A1G8QNT7_9BACI|nr:hypothetical protein [Alteribacillus bidgolensis]SDJ06338.1 hypothetical protein SAMN05216352_12113 [Alteribacillus bidgolensis]